MSLANPWVELTMIDGQKIIGRALRDELDRFNKPQLRTDPLRQFITVYQQHGTKPVHAAIAYIVTWREVSEPVEVPQQSISSPEQFIYASAETETPLSGPVRRSGAI